MASKMVNFPKNSRKKRRGNYPGRKHYADRRFTNVAKNSISIILVRQGLPVIDGAQQMERCNSYRRVDEVLHLCFEHSRFTSTTA